MFVQLFLTIFILYAIWMILKKPSKYPPGPWGLPLIGYLPFGMKNFRAKLKELQEKHYPVFSWRIGSHLLIFVCDYKMIKEAFQNQNYADRPRLIFLSSAEDVNEGITASNGFHWHTVRKFSFRHLRDLGMGKSKMASAVQHEANELVKVMKKQEGKIAPVPKQISTAIINILWQMVADKRYDFDDDAVVSLDNDIHELQNSLGFLIIRDIFPWLDSILPEAVMEFITKKSVHTKQRENITRRFQKYIDEHVETLDEKYPRDFIDEYLIEIEKRKDDPDNTMTKEDLLECVTDLFEAGLETTKTTLHWCIFHLAKYQEIQKELQKEIESVLPNGLSPTYEDKSKMPKMEAFITEILRFTSIAQFGLPRTVSIDTKLAGYYIPKGSIIIAAQKIVHFDRRNHDSPESFNPKRFLDSNGQFVSPKEGFLPFGIVTMLQHVEFHPPPNKDINLNPLDIPMFTIPHFGQDILIKAKV